jgi:hypothetical protein
MVAVAWSDCARQKGRRGGVPQQIKERTFHRIAVLRIVEDIVGYRGSHGGNTGSSPVGSANKISSLGYEVLTCSMGVRQKYGKIPAEALG